YEQRARLLGARSNSQPAMKQGSGIRDQGSRIRDTSSSPDTLTLPRAVQSLRPEAIPESPRHAVQSGALFYGTRPQTLAWRAWVERVAPRLLFAAMAVYVLVF